MKTIFTFLIFSLLAFSSNAQWIELDTGMENPPVFNDVYAITPETVVVVGNNGTILKTTNGGETWQQKPSGTTSNLSKVQFPTPEIGYIVGGSGLLKTTDGGETWISVDTGNDCTPYNFSSVNENLIFATCNGNLMKSENGGTEWNIAGILPYFVDKIQFLNNEIGFVGSYFWSNYETEIAKTDNGGGSWQEVNAVSPFHFLNENIGFYFFNNLYKTVDGGIQFDLVTDVYGDGEYTLLDIFALNENTIWGILYWETLDYATPVRGIIKISENETDGYSIVSFPHTHNNYLNAIHFADENTGYIVGSKGSGDSFDGLIWKNGTGINEPLNTVDDKITNSTTVYPNPASKEINIAFDDSFSGIISLNDLTGKQVYSSALTNKHNTTINVENLPQGTYILSVKSKQGNFSQKILIN